jgi:hypothetical protein
MSKTKKTNPCFKVGDWVTFPYGTRNAIAQVIEDRGPIGVRGRRLYRIEIQFEDREPARFEMPEEEMKGTAPPQKAAPVS